MVTFVLKLYFITPTSFRPKVWYVQLQHEMISMKNFIFPGALSEMDTYPLLFLLGLTWRENTRAIEVCTLSLEERSSR